MLKNVIEFKCISKNLLTMTKRPYYFAIGQLKNTKIPGIKLECSLKNTWHKIRVQIEFHLDS